MEVVERVVAVETRLDIHDKRLESTGYSTAWGRGSANVTIYFDL